MNLFTDYNTFEFIPKSLLPDACQRIALEAPTGFDDQFVENTGTFCGVLLNSF